MNRKMTILVITVLALAGLLFWARRDALQTPEKEGTPHTMSVGEDFNDVMNSLSQNMSPWPGLRPEQKRAAVGAVIQLFRQQQQGNIALPVDFYVRQIDQTLASNPGSRNLSLDRMLFILAVMSYDFDNGQDKDELARRVLGEEVYAANKLRMEAARQQEAAGAQAGAEGG